MGSRGGADLVGRRSDAAVLDAARCRERVDRGTLATLTGLTPQAVSNVLARLGEAGLVEAAGERRQGVGKPATEYRLRDGSRQAVGVQVNRRGIRLARVDLRGQVRSQQWHDLRPDFTPAAVLDHLRTGCAELAAEVADDQGTLVGVGIGTVGPVDHRGGVVRQAYGLSHWRDVPLRALAEDALGLPVLVDKDVTAAATGQAWALGEHAGDTALVIVEAGVGAGLWLRGAAHRGARLNAGEFGHAVVDLNGSPCICGRRGCLEITHAEAAASGDIAAAAAVVAVGTLNLVETLDVEQVVLAGSDFLAHADVYLGAVSAAIERHRPPDTWPAVTVSAAHHGESCVAAGAGVQVLQQFCFSATAA